MDFADSLIKACETLARTQGISARAAILLGGGDPLAGEALRQHGLEPAGAPDRALSDADRTVGVVAWRRGVLADLAAAGPLMQSLAAVVIIGIPVARRAELHRSLFDRGFLDAGAASDDVAVFVRSSLIANPHAAGMGARSVIAMSNLGHNAGFANQLFQYAFLRLYGLRNDAAVETPQWSGEAVYGIDRRDISRPLPMLKGDEWSVRDLEFWTRARPPVNVDFWGYFQNPPPSWHQHRAFLRRLFTPCPAWSDPVRRWLDTHRPPGTTLVAIHVRRGDYLRYAATKPWFRPIPETWYLRWLAQIWPTLENPVLLVATDDRATVLPAFADYAPLTAADAESMMSEPRFLADFEIMAHADVLAVCNSSFSHMPALLAPPAQRCFIASIAAESFEPYDPWATDDFWRRFGAPTERRRSLLPRFLRGSTV
jgi:hypothetical protein